MSQTNPKIWLLGASLETNNLGLSALAESTLTCIFHRWSSANVFIPTPKTNQPPEVHVINGKTVSVEKIELWYGKNIFKTHNIYTLFIFAMLSKLLPFNFWRNWLRKKNPQFDALMQVDFVMDITGGDSFTDLYNMERLRKSILLKWLVILSGKKLILLPQTYGPFKKRVAKTMAKHILTHAAAVFSRDQQGIKTVNELLADKANQQFIRFIPDVAFVLEKEQVNSDLTQQLTALKAQGKTIVGLNVSGLLYSNNYNNQSGNWFGLKDNYPELIHNLIHYFMQHPDVVIVLVPHVLSPKKSFESDPRACEDIHAKMETTYPDRIFWVQDRLTHKQTKYVIGHCDFFLGSRMHACIGAISQHIPTVGLAYSGKFIGVFESVGVGDTVLDLRHQDNQTILSQVTALFDNRLEKAEKLQQTLPKIQKQVLQLFNEIDF